jgi:hypothetical protein
MTASTAGTAFEGMQEEVNKAIESEIDSDDQGAVFAQKFATDMLGAINSENIKNNALTSILASLFTLFGALLMWNLRSIGFWVYVAGTLISIIAPLIIYQGNILGGLSAILIGFIGLVFIVLYAINKKQLVH